MKVYAWPNYIHICDGEYVIIIRLYMWIMNQSKDGFGIWHALLSIFDHYNKSIISS